MSSYRRFTTLKAFSTPHWTQRKNPCSCLSVAWTLLSKMLAASYEKMLSFFIRNSYFSALNIRPPRLSTCLNPQEFYWLEMKKFPFFPLKRQIPFLSAEFYISYFRLPPASEQSLVCLSNWNVFSCALPLFLCTRKRLKINVILFNLTLASLCVCRRQPFFFYCVDFNWVYAKTTPHRMFPLNFYLEGKALKTMKAEKIVITIRAGCALWMWRAIGLLACLQHLEMIWNRFKNVHFLLNKIIHTR